MASDLIASEATIQELAHELINQIKNDPNATREIFDITAKEEIVALAKKLLLSAQSFLQETQYIQEKVDLSNTIAVWNAIKSTREGMASSKVNNKELLNKYNEAYTKFLIDCYYFNEVILTFLYKEPTSIGFVDEEIGSIYVVDGLTALERGDIKISSVGKLRGSIQLLEQGKKYLQSYTTLQDEQKTDTYLKAVQEAFLLAIKDYDYIHTKTKKHKRAIVYKSSLTDNKWKIMNVAGGHGDIQEAYMSLLYSNQILLSMIGQYENLTEFARNGIAKVGSASGLYATDIQSAKANIAVKAMTNASMAGCKQMLQSANDICKGLTYEQLLEKQGNALYKNYPDIVNKGAIPIERGLRNKERKFTRDFQNLVNSNDFKTTFSIST